MDDYRKDRTVIEEDEKQRILDLTSFKFVPPDVGIYDGQLRYYAANLEWARKIEGFLSWLATTAAWPEAENDQYHAIQQILIFLEGVEMSIDYDALKQSIKEGTYEAWNDLAKQVVSGRTTNISVGEDGTVTDPSTGVSDADLPEDDPATVIDETESARYGGDIEVAEKLETFIAQIDTLYGPTNGTEVTSATDAKNMIGLLYPVDQALMSAAIDGYYAYRATNNRLLWSADATTAQYFYCNGFSKNAIARYFYTLAYTTQKFQIITNLVFALSDLFFSQYFEIGTTKPSNAYLDAACVPIAFQEFLNVPFASARVTTPLKANHRMKFRISGVSNDSADSDWQDAFWYYNAATGIYTRTNPTFTHSAGSNQPSDNQVVRNASHIYEYTIDLGNLNAAMTITMNKNAGMSAGASNPNFHIEIWDLGLAISQ